MPRILPAGLLRGALVQFGHMPYLDSRKETEEVDLGPKVSLLETDSEATSQADSRKTRTGHRFLEASWERTVQQSGPPLRGLLQTLQHRAAMRS